MRSELVSSDAEAVVRLTCYEDLLTVVVGEHEVIEEAEWYYRPHAPGNASGRYKGGEQDSATSVSWQALVTSAGDPTVRGVYLPKSYRRGFINALRSGSLVIIDWFYDTHTFEWPDSDDNYEPPLEACGW